MKNNSDRKTIEMISQAVDLAEKALLEVGCGNGRLTALLEGKPASLVAVDPDKASIDEARRKVTGADFLVGSGEALEFSDGSFDVILFSLSLHHLNSRVALQEASRVLTDDGVVLVLEPLPDGGLAQVCTLVHNEDRQKQEAQQAITESGWTIARSEAFTCQWEFETPEEMYGWVFECFDTPMDDALVRQMAEQPGVDLGTRPVTLQESLVLQVLKRQRA